MEGLVNYSSEDEQDDYPYKKVAVRDRSGGAACSGRTSTEATLKRSYDQAKNDSLETGSPYRKGRDYGNDSFKIGNSNHNEDKYKIDRRADNSRDHKEKRDGRETRYNRDTRDEESGQKYEYKKLDDHKRHREHKRDYKRDSNDYHRDDKRYNRYEERKSAYTPNNKDRFSNSRSRHDDRKLHDDRFSDERRGGSGGGGSYIDDRRKEHNERRNYNNDDDRKADRRNDDRRTQRSYNDDRSNAYRPRRSSSPLPPPHHNKGSNKCSERKEESNTKRERRRHSRSRSRSRSHSPDKSIDSTKISNQRTATVESFGEFKRPETESQNSEKKALPNARNFEALLTLPLSEKAPKQPNVVTVPATSVAVGSSTATVPVQLPSYYNPNVINPNKYVEQMQKRKLIWGAKKTEDSVSKWGHAQFSQDQDGKVASKFMRLMGIKNATGASVEVSTSPTKSETKKPSSVSPPNNIDVKSREAMFSTMEHQYEVARQVTHTMRGVGLGFSSQSRPY